MKITLRLLPPVVVLRVRHDDVGGLVLNIRGVHPSFDRTVLPNARQIPFIISVRILGLV
jgi:hypothetical protein